VSQPAARRVTWSHVVLVAAGMVLMWLGESLFWPGRGLVWRHAQTKATAQTSAGSGKVSGATGATGAWGRIEYTPIALNRPEEYFAGEITQKVKTAWVFRNRTTEQVTALFSSLGLPGSTLAQLTNRANWEILPSGIRVWPPVQAVVSMAESRRRLYHLLAQDSENQLQVRPFRFRAKGFDDWFADCGLRPDKVDLVRRLTYEEGPNLCFADAPAFAELSTPEETKLLVQCLWRVSTFVMRVHIDAETDVDGVLKYWGRFGAEKAYRPLLESMARVPEGSSINISYFLPPFARLRLYTYPDPREANVARQDCFWSAMNFFSSEPDDGFFRHEHTQEVLKKEYARVADGARQFGDLLLLLRHDNQALHMCVYMADDVVFTKNGWNTQQPWVLMRISEMLAEYEKEKPFEVVVYRRKTPPALSAAASLSPAAPLP